MATQVTVKQKKEDIKGLLINHSIKDVQFGYNEVTLVLNGGNEIVIGSEMAGHDSSMLTVETYVTERKNTGRVELDF